MNYLYLLLLPLVIFHDGNKLYLVISIILGFLLYSLFGKRSVLKLGLILAITLAVFLILKPKLGLDSGFINIINSQRGEHSIDGILPKLLHNKSDFVHVFIENFDKLLSPVAIFASGFWHEISPYYPLGYLFPWDIYFLYRFFKNRKDKTNIFFWMAILLLILLSGLLHIDYAEIFSFAIVTFLAILVSRGYTASSKRIAFFAIVFDLIFILTQFSLLKYFYL